LTSTTDATGGSSETYTYQWIESSDKGATWKAISGATSKDYAPPALTATTLYRLVTSGAVDENVCTVDTSNVVTVTVHSIALSNYPDIRLSVCRDAGTSVNLSRYIDSLGVTDIQWNSLSGIPITPSEGVISMDNLPIAGVYSFTYTVNNICKSGIKRKVYLEVLNNRIVRQVKDTVVICYLYAEAVNINRLFGIEAGGEWTYSSVSGDVESYVKQSTSSVYGGAVVMDGKSFYEAGSLSLYHGVAAKMVKFTYKSNVNSCLHDEDYDMVIVFTDNMFN
jgi:hypothetical protein